MTDKYPIYLRKDDTLNAHDLTGKVYAIPIEVPVTFDNRAELEEYVRLVARVRPQEMRELFLFKGRWV